ncbi:hypothetical protein DENSPDRAFT_164837 [Dentipellis sp. KUC8613]|nr:hypothetical protein DENSPDRAFT_164837 [Dentipellis sp. KUC8613]
MSSSTITGGTRPLYFLMNPAPQRTRKRVAKSPKIAHADKPGRVRSDRRKKEVLAPITQCNLEAETKEPRNPDSQVCRIPGSSLDGNNDAVYKECNGYVPHVSERTLQWVRSQRHTNVNIEYEEYLAAFRKRRAMRRAAMGQNAVPGNAGLEPVPEHSWVA